MSRFGNQLTNLVHNLLFYSKTLLNNVGYLLFLNLELIGYPSELVILNLIRPGCCESLGCFLSYTDRDKVSKGIGLHGGRCSCTQAT